jgi:hypothetical protein
VVKRVRKYVRKVSKNNKEMVYGYSRDFKGFMALLMKQRNTGRKWTKEEKRELRTHLKNLSEAVPIIIIFLLPGGMFLLPIYVYFLDRRRNRKNKPAAAPHAAPLAAAPPADASPAAESQTPDGPHRPNPAPDLAPDPVSPSP